MFDLVSLMARCMMPKQHRINQQELTAKLQQLCLTYSDPSKGQMQLRLDPAYFFTSREAAEQQWAAARMKVLSFPDLMSQAQAAGYDKEWLGFLDRAREEPVPADSILDYILTPAQLDGLQDARFMRVLPGSSRVSRGIGSELQCDSGICSSQGGQAGGRGHSEAGAVGGGKGVQPLQGLTLAALSGVGWMGWRTLKALQKH